MASVNYWFSYWVSTWPDSMLPGAAHDWIYWGFDYGDVVTVTAHPLNGDEFDSPGILAVENVRIHSNETGRRMLFTVRNVGPQPVDGYGMGHTFIRA